MVRALFLCITVLLLTTNALLAAETAPCDLQLIRSSNAIDKVYIAPAPFSRSQSDTVFFGGDDGNGIACEGGIWDFDTIVSDPLQGFTSRDRTTNPAVYFGRVDASDFSGDPCSPMLPGATGQLWVGIHEEEANGRDFPGGMGYQNHMCQRAYSPLLPRDDGSLDISFRYFNDTEINYDYTYIYIACYDENGVQLLWGASEYPVDYLNGVIGTPDTPEVYSTSVDQELLPTEAVYLKLLLKMWSDGGWSDEDGNWDTPCGPFACTDVSITSGDAYTGFFNFEDDDQGWSFDRCPGIGTFMGIVDAATYENWLEQLGLICDCAIYDNALEMVDEDNSPFSPPGHPIGQDEEIISGAVPRGSYQPPEYNTTLVYVTTAAFLTLDRSTFVRPGYKVYPYTSPVNPIPHWSARNGQTFYTYFGADASCNRREYNLSTLNGNAGNPIPTDWDSCKFIYDIICSAGVFGQDPTLDEGNTFGTPLLDNISVALTSHPNAPVITENGGGNRYMDGFGHNFPTYLEPGDRGNANTVRDFSPPYTFEVNDWLGDSIVINGPDVSSSDPLTEWNCYLCFKLTHVGPRQHMVPEYLAWKSRLTGDPEEAFVCVQMDSLEFADSAYNSKFVTYFHEDDPGYDGAAGDLNESNEILPDGVFTPGTAIEYYFRSEWANIANSESYIYPPNHAEFEILPRMRLSGDTDYSVEWPSFLYIDVYNRGAEYYIMPAFDQLGIEVDRYDYLDSASGWRAPMLRSISPTGPYNPGGYGNNGCTVEQLLGYRMIFLSAGTLGVGCMEPADWVLFSRWLDATECDLPSFRRGIIFDGDQISSSMLHVIHQPEGGDLFHQYLGADRISENYLEYADDEEYCVHLSGIGAEFEPLVDTSIYGNGCPTMFPYSVIGVHGGVPGALGNLVYDNPLVGETEFAQIVRSNVSDPYNWRSIINGFSTHHLSWVDCGGETCASGSSCVVNGAVSILLPSLNWILDGADPFDPWFYPCSDAGVEDDPVTHSQLKVNYLRGASPNPFRGSATIRFNLAESGVVAFAIYDVSGRLVKTLEENRFDAGENAIVWDGTNESGNQVSGGIFWMQMTTNDGFSSGKKMIVLR
jgi:FlgD Ig-like domain